MHVAAADKGVDHRAGGEANYRREHANGKTASLFLPARLRESGLIACRIGHGKAGTISGEHPPPAPQLPLLLSMGQGFRDLPGNPGEQSGGKPLPRLAVAAGVL